MKQIVNRSGWGIALVVLAGFLAAGPAVAYAQQRATDDVENAVLVAPRAEVTEEPQWGGSASSVLTISSWEFTAWDDSVQDHTNYNRWSPSAQEVEAPVQLPSGALVSAIELEGCDTNASGQIVFVLIRHTNPGFTSISTLGGTGVAAVPGCSKFTQLVTPNVTIDNTSTYSVAIRSSALNTTSYTAMRVVYKLQVSPAPGTATFPNDVPTGHQYFRFIEALARSGVTGGCGSGRFCPDNFVTRGEMAVFLSSALGLHFAP